MEFRLVVKIDLVMSPVGPAYTGTLCVDGATNLLGVPKHLGWADSVCLAVDSSVRVNIAVLTLSVIGVGVVIVRILVVVLILAIAAQTRIVVLALAATALTGIVLALTAAAHARVVAIGTQVAFGILGNRYIGDCFPFFGKGENEHSILDKYVIRIEINKVFVKSPVTFAPMVTIKAVKVISPI